MFRALISAQFCNLCDRVLAVGEIVLGQFYSLVKYIFHTGYSKGFPVKGLHVTGTDIQPFCHIGNTPLKAWIALDFQAESQQIFPALDRGRTTVAGFRQFVKKQME